MCQERGRQLAKQATVKLRQGRPVRCCGNQQRQQPELQLLIWLGAVAPLFRRQVQLLQPLEAWCGVGQRLALCRQCAEPLAS